VADGCASVRLRPPDPRQLYDALPEEMRPLLFEAGRPRTVRPSCSARVAAAQRT
jgi:hypothetical protein